MISKLVDKIKWLKNLSREGYLIWICRLRLSEKIRLSS